MANKAVKRISIEINKSIGEIVFTLANGRALTFHAERAAGTRDEAALFGWARKIANEAAMSRDEGGASASDDVKFDAMKGMVEHLETGTDQWNPNRSGARVAGADMALLVAALMELYPKKTRDELTAWAKSKAPDARAALMVRDDIKAIVDRLRSALAADVDTDEMLAELNDLS